MLTTPRLRSVYSGRRTLYQWVEEAIVLFFIAVTLRLYSTPSINAHADQNCCIDTNVDQFRSIPLNAEVFRINAMILIGIDCHWALIEGVLTVVTSKLPRPQHTTTR